MLHKYGLIYNPCFLTLELTDHMSHDQILHVIILCLHMKQQRFAIVHFYGFIWLLNY